MYLRIFPDYSMLASTEVGLPTHRLSRMVFGIAVVVAIQLEL
jgi:hypothetical protein